MTTVEHPIGSDLLKLYKELDEKRDVHLEAHEGEISCRKGCSHCCYMMSGITLSEGLLLAEVAAFRPDWKKIQEDLFRMARKEALDSMDRGTYFNLGIPCAFLNKKEGTCRVYEHRPSCCRYYYVVSDPSICSRHHPDGTVSALNLTHLEAAVYEFAAEVQQDGGPGLYVER